MLRTVAREVLRNWLTMYFSHKRGDGSDICSARQLVPGGNFDAGWRAPRRGIAFSLDGAGERVCRRARATGTGRSLAAHFPFSSGSGCRGALWDIVSTCGLPALHGARRRPATRPRPMHGSAVFQWRSCSKWSAALHGWQRVRWFWDRHNRDERCRCHGKRSSYGPGLRHRNERHHQLIGHGKWSSDGRWSWLECQQRRPSSPTGSRWGIPAAVRSR